VQDTPEANKLCCVYDFWLASRPCRICNIELEDLPTARVPGRLRTHTETISLVRKNRPIIMNHVPFARHDGCAQAKAEMKESSLHPVINTFWRAPFGENPHGVHGACSPEALHQCELGLMKEVHGGYVSLVSGTFDPTNSTEKKKKKKSKPAELDRRVRYLAPFLVHQSDREIPTKAFSRGVTDLTKLHGQEMPAVLLMLILAVGDSGVILPTPVSRPIARLAWGLLCFHSYLMSSVWNRGMRTRFPGLTTYIMDKFAEVIGPIRKTDADQTGLKFPKFHQILHYLFFLEMFGPPVLGYGGFWESAMKFFVKKTTERTQRRAPTLVGQARTQCPALGMEHPLDMTKSGA
jgi:hypothetical protein